MPPACPREGRWAFAEGRLRPARSFRGRQGGAPRDVGCRRLALRGPGVGARGGATVAALTD
eukprot:12598072-Alexandrium_andersonii.AAC.1